MWADYNIHHQTLQYKCKFVLTGPGSSTSPRFCIGDVRMKGVASENNKTHTNCIPGGVTRKVRFRNWYDIASSPLNISKRLRQFGRTNRTGHNLTEQNNVMAICEHHWAIACHLMLSSHNVELRSKSLLFSLTNPGWWPSNKTQPLMRFIGMAMLLLFYIGKLLPSISDVSKYN